MLIRPQSPKILSERWEILSDNGLTAFAISSHLVGQAVCDLIDERHKSILPPDVWGEGDPEKVRRRAAKKLAKTAKACRNFINEKPGRGKKDDFPAVVNGFTGSSVWHSIYAFPPTDQAFWDKGFAISPNGLDLSCRSLIKTWFCFGGSSYRNCFDIASAERALAAVKGHKRFGFNYDPSHLGYQGVDYVKFIRTFPAYLSCTHEGCMVGAAMEQLVFLVGTTFADPRRQWDFRSVGRSDVDFEEIIVALNDIGYGGPLSVEWEDSRMDRFHGAESLATSSSGRFRTESNGL